MRSMLLPLGTDSCRAPTVVNPSKGVSARVGNGAVSRLTHIYSPYDFPCLFGFVHFSGLTQALCIWLRFSTWLVGLLGMNIRPSCLFRNNNLTMIKIESRVHFEPRRALAIVDAEGRKILTIYNHCYSEKYILIGRTTCAACQPKH